MFKSCNSLPDIRYLENWNVSNGNNFRYMFSDCSSLNDIKPLEKWNISNGIDFSYMFQNYSSLRNINSLQNGIFQIGKISHIYSMDVTCYQI